MTSGFIFALVLAAIVAVVAYKGICVVPQQTAWVVERLGRFHAVLNPGLNLVIPFIDRIAYRHSLKEVPLDTPQQICITKDNTQLSVDGVLFFQVTDPQRASYGTSNYVIAITQLAQTTLRSVIGRMELDRTFEERDTINHSVVSAIDEAALNWGVKVLRYEIKDLTPPNVILQAMQRQITAEREKRAVVELDNKLANRSVNEGFSGGEKKRNEIFQMAMLEPRLSILDETDSGLDIDALRIVAEGVNKLKTPETSTIVITHYQRLLDYIKPDIVHVLYKGRIVKTAGPELALELEKRGYDWIKEEVGE